MFLCFPTAAKKPIDGVTFAGIGPEQDNLQDAAALIPVRTAFRQRVLEFGMQNSTTRANSSCLCSGK